MPFPPLSAAVDTLVATIREWHADKARLAAAIDVFEASILPHAPVRDVTFATDPAWCVVLESVPEVSVQDARLNSC